MSTAFSSQQYLKFRQVCTSFLATITLIFSIGCGAAGSRLLGGGTPSKPQNPTANAGGSYSANVNQSITFDASKSTASSGQTLAFAWEFGDGGTGSGVSTNHTYTAPGAYTATLTVTASGGGTATATAAVTVNAVAVANAGGPYSGNVGQAIAFDGSKSAAPSGQTLTYAWDFGDGTGSGVNPTHTYTKASSYTATVTVTASGGTSATASAAVTITPAVAASANAGGPYSGSINQPKTFDGSKSTAPSGQTLTYSWDFGDRASGVGVNPVHTYQASGVYKVALTVAWGQSGNSSAQTTATITDGSASAFTVHIVNHTDDPSGQTWMTIGLLNGGYVPLKSVKIASAQLATTALSSTLPIIVGDIGPAQEATVSFPISTQNYLSASSQSIELKGNYSLSGQALNFDFLTPLDDDPGAHGQSMWSPPNDFPGGPPLRGSMEGPLLAGFLPAVESGGNAKEDELAAELAAKVAAGGQDAVGALMQALLTAGFEIRGPNGTYDTSVLSGSSSGQGLAIDGWEIANVSNQYAQEYGVGINTFGKAMAAGIPSLGVDDVSPVLISDIAQAANSSDADMRFLARFFVELGRKGDAHYDLLSTTLNTNQVRLDAIQTFLIMARLAGDIASLAPPDAQVARLLNARPLADENAPCNAGAVGDLILGINYDAQKVMFGRLIAKFKLLSEANAEVLGQANGIIAAAKFILNYAFISADIIMNGDALQRRKDTQAGERKTLTMTLENNSGKFQRTNCFQIFLSLVGSGFSLLPEENTESAGVRWVLSDMPPPVFGGFVGGFFSLPPESLAASPYVRFVDTSPQTRRYIQSIDKTAVNGVSTVDIEGSPRSTDLSNELVRTVDREFTAYTYLRLVNPFPSEGLGLTETASKVATAVIEGYLGGTKEPAFWIDNAAELSYRRYFFAPAIKKFRVIDYEPCNGVWSGDVDYEIHRRILINGDPPATVGFSSSDETWFESGHITGTTFDYDYGNGSIVSSVNTDVDGEYSYRRTDENERFEILRDSDPPISCIKSNLSAVTNGANVLQPQTGSISISDGKYQFSIPMIPVNAQSTLSQSEQETCPPPRDDHSDSFTQSMGNLNPEVSYLAGSGVIDPKDPNHIKGSSTQDTSTDIATMTTTVRWDLTRSCGKQ